MAHSPKCQKAVAQALTRAGLAACIVATGSAQILQLGPPVDGGPAIREVQVPGNGMGFAGFATHDAAGAVIYYDSVWMGRIGGYSSPEFRFTRAHEYAHHRLNHPLEQYTAPPQALPFLSYKSELEADCWAAQQLAGRGDRDGVLAGAGIYDRYVPAEDGGRPGAARRKQEMSRCSGIGFATALPAGSNGGIDVPGGRSTRSRTSGSQATRTVSCTEDRTTDEQGRFRIATGLGTFSVTVSADGYRGREFSNVTTHARGPVDLEVRLQTGRGTARDPSTGTQRNAMPTGMQRCITGTVLTAEGIPIAGARVTIERH